MEEQKVFMLIEIAPKKSKASRRAAETHFANTLQFMNPIFGERPPSHSEGIKQPTIKETAGKMLRSGLVPGTCDGRVHIFYDCVALRDSRKCLKFH